MQLSKAMVSKMTDDKDKLPTIEIDKVIHEPARLTIMSYLFVLESADFLFLLSQTKLTKGNLSSHLSKLEASGYVVIEKEFVEKIPRTMISLRSEGREALLRYRFHMREILNSLPGEELE